MYFYILKSLCQRLFLYVFAQDYKKCKMKLFATTLVIYLYIQRTLFENNKCTKLEEDKKLTNLQIFCDTKTS